jgi:hypothetical protein
VLISAGDHDSTCASSDGAWAGLGREWSRLEQFLSAVPDSERMTKWHDIHAQAELELLFSEIRLYLEAVETFRREGREPIWKRDVPMAAPQ